MPDQSDDVAHAVSGPAPAPDNRPAGGAITAAGTGTGRSEGFLKPVYYARSRESYRPPPDLYRRLNHWLGPAVTSSGLSPRCDHAGGPWPPVWRGPPHPHGPDRLRW